LDFSYRLMNLLYSIIFSPPSRSPTFCVLNVHAQSMIRYSHAMTYLMAYHNEKTTKTMSIMLQVRLDDITLSNV